MPLQSVQGERVLIAVHTVDNEKVRDLKIMQAVCIVCILNVYIEYP